MATPDSPRPTGPGFSPTPWIPGLLAPSGRTATVGYLRAHLYGASAGIRLARRVVAEYDDVAGGRLTPFPDEFEDEIAEVRYLLGELTPVGAPLRLVASAATASVLAVLPRRSGHPEPFLGLALVEALRTLVVAKRSMWVLLIDGPHARPSSPGRFGELRDRALRQEEVLEELRMTLGRRALA